MKTQHTPGQWQTTGPHAIRNDSSMIRINSTGAGGLGVAYVATPEDARLIASSPDLLEALVEVDRFLADGGVLHGGALSPVNDGATMVQYIRQVIREATGEA